MNKNKLKIGDIVETKKGRGRLVSFEGDDSAQVHFVWKTSDGFCAGIDFVYLKDITKVCKMKKHGDTQPGSCVENDGTSHDRSLRPDLPQRLV